MSDPCGKVGLPTNERHKMALALYYSTVDVTTPVEFEVGDSYDMLSKGVGGYIECVTIQNDIDMWVNEEGKIIGLEPNALATHFYWSAYPSMINRDVIHGDVVFTGGADEEGDTLGLDRQQLEYLLGPMGVEMSDLSAMLGSK